MNDKVYCGNDDALIGFLYDECAPGERDAIAAHVTRCMSCAEEIQSLRLTRGRLAAWAPRTAALGFRITPEMARAGLSDPPTVLTSPRWWAQPLPAWAQMAAAVAIFAAGMTLGSSRASVVDDRVSATTSAPASMVPASVSQKDFDALRAEVSRLRAVTASAPAEVPDAALVRQVASLVDQRVNASELRLRGELATDTAQLTRDLRIILARDLSTVQASVDGFQRLTEAELVEQREAIKRWNGVISAGRIVPTSVVR
jgi:hypothetical protein